MTDRVPIRILQAEGNQRGDLFVRLMGDLFVALGYDMPRMNVHKAGRELDLTASHRMERRRAVAECKATGEVVGGAELNKFVGALDAEHEDEESLAGYFISLGGFTETALEQERVRRRTKIVTLDASQVVDQLVEGRILVAKAVATETAGRMCGHEALRFGGVEVVGHSRGWFWVVYYEADQVRRAFAVVRSDGEAASQEIAKELKAAD